MKHAGFHYHVEAQLSLTKAEHGWLMTASKHHYDGVCQALSSPGEGAFLYGWSHAYEGKAETDEETHHVTSRQVQLLCKILELCQHVEGRVLGLKLRAVALIMSHEQSRVNALTAVGHRP